MPDSPPCAEKGDAADAPPDRGSTTGMPRWVMVSAVIALVVVVLVVVMLLVGGLGGHGPGRHS